MTTPCDDEAPKAAPMTPSALKKAAQEMSGLALETLASIMRGTGQDTAKLGAAREILDRAHGKPKPAPKAKTRAPAKVTEAMTVIVKRFSDVTLEDEAQADATEARS